MATKHITYLDNSGYMVELPTVTLVFDYYRDPAHKVVKALERRPDIPVVFFVTHHHPDHFNPDIFNLGQNHRRLYVLSNDIPSRDVRSDIPAEWMSRGDIAEGLTAGLRVQAFGSTDAGVSYYVTMPDGFTLFHAGDLNCWHWKEESTLSEIARAREAYNVELGRIAQAMPAVDVAFFPVDVRQGDECAEGAEAFLTKVATGAFFAMHFKGDSDKACRFEAYRLPEDVAGRTRFYCLDTPGQSVDL